MNIFFKKRFFWPFRLKTCKKVIKKSQNPMSSTALFFRWPKFGIKGSTLWFSVYGISVTENSRTPKSWNCHRAYGIGPVKFSVVTTLWGIPLYYFNAPFFQIPIGRTEFRTPYGNWIELGDRTFRWPVLSAVPPLISVYGISVTETRNHRKL